MTPEQIQSLLSAEAYPHWVGDIRLLETHISWIILTGDFVYKIKKPVDFGFVDFSTPELRRRFCWRELELNQALAGCLYVGVKVIREVSGRLVITEADAAGPWVDHAVCLRQFPQEWVLGNPLMDVSLLGDHHWLELAERLAQFHQSSTQTQAELAGSDDGGVAQVRQDALDNFAQMRPYLKGWEDDHSLQWLESWTAECLESLTGVLARRQRDWLRRCHGDLHLGNIVFYNNALVPFDCIEFNDSLSCIDVASELAFLLMDLDMHGLRRQAFLILNRYLRVTGDYGMVTVLDFYKVYRAMVRAKVTMLSATTEMRKDFPQTDLYPGFKAYLDYALGVIRGQGPFLIIMHGLSGSGKSTVAEYLATHLGAICLHSDVERKRLHDVPLADRSGASQGLYSRRASERTFLRLEQLAQQCLDAGWSCVVDATFLSRRLRDRFCNLGRQAGLPWMIVSCEVGDEAELKRRLDQRWCANIDASDATVATMLRQREAQDVFDETEWPDVLVHKVTEAAQLPSLLTLVRARLGCV